MQTKPMDPFTVLFFVGVFALFAVIGAACVWSLATQGLAL